MQNIRHRVVDFYTLRPRISTFPTASELGIPEDIYRSYQHDVQSAHTVIRNENLQYLASHMLLNIANGDYANMICGARIAQTMLSANLNTDCLSGMHAQRYIDMALCGYTKEQTFLAMSHDVGLYYHSNMTTYLAAHISSDKHIMDMDEVLALYHELCDEEQNALTKSSAAIVLRTYKHMQSSFSEKKITHAYHKAKYSREETTVSIKALSGGLCTPK